jgi:hypothetical protein
MKFDIKHQKLLISVICGKVLTFKAKSILMGLMLLFGCKNQNPERLILGAWKVDSIYTFYNGFDFMRRSVGEDPGLEFKTNGLGIFSIREEQRPFRYTIRLPDTVKLMTDDSSRVLYEYKIYQLTPHNMVLRQEKKTLFKEKNQDRYEIRYLSRTVD